MCDHNDNVLLTFSMRLIRSLSAYNIFSEIVRIFFTAGGYNLSAEAASRTAIHIFKVIIRYRVTTLWIVHWLRRESNMIVFSFYILSVFFFSSMHSRASQELTRSKWLGAITTVIDPWRCLRVIACAMIIQWFCRHRAVRVNRMACASYVTCSCRNTMVRTTTIPPWVEFGLRSVGMWPTSPYPNLFFNSYMIFLAVVQYYQYAYVIVHFDARNLSLLMDGLGLSLATSLALLKLVTLRWHRR